MVTSPFLTAEWRQLVMLNWRVDPALLEKHVPRGTALDLYEGAAWISLVGFLFLRTRVLGIGIPLHRDFEEINLRFYVQRIVDGDVRHGVCFLREIVSLPAIAVTARMTFNEPYTVADTRHLVESPGVRGEPERVEYSWRRSGTWSRVGARELGVSQRLIPGSLRSFPAERHWGYTRQRDGGTIEYEVEHPRWRVRPITAPVVEGNLAATFGPQFAVSLETPPHVARTDRTFQLKRAS